MSHSVLNPRGLLQARGITVIEFFNKLLFWRSNKSTINTETQAQQAQPGAHSCASVSRDCAQPYTVHFSKKQPVQQTTPFLSGGSLSSVAKNYKHTKNTNKSKCSVHSFHTSCRFSQLFFFFPFSFQAMICSFEGKKKQSTDH